MKQIFLNHWQIITYCIISNILLYLNIHKVISDAAYFIGLVLTSVIWLVYIVRDYYLTECAKADEKIKEILNGQG